MKLEVTKKNALAAFVKANTEGKEMLKNLFGQEHFNQKITDRIKTMDDVYEAEGIDKDKFIKGFMFQEDLDAANVRLITKVFNEGWEPDFTNSSQPKYVLWFDLSSGVGFSYSAYDDWNAIASVGSRLLFKSKDVALSAFNSFPKEFEKYIVIKK